MMSDNKASIKAKALMKHRQEYVTRAGGDNTNYFAGGLAATGFFGSKHLAGINQVPYRMTIALGLFIGGHNLGMRLFGDENYRAEYSVHEYLMLRGHLKKNELSRLKVEGDPTHLEIDVAAKLFDSQD